MQNLSRQALSSQNIGNALYGLKSMDSEVSEVRALVRALTAKIQDSREPLDTQAIGNALYGLQHMRCGCCYLRLLQRQRTEAASRGVTQRAARCRVCVRLAVIM